MIQHKARPQIPRALSEPLLMLELLFPHDPLLFGLKTFRIAFSSTPQTCSHLFQPEFRKLPHRRQPYGQCQSFIPNKLSIELRLMIYELILGPDSCDDSVRLLGISRENTKIYMGNPTSTCIKFEKFKMCWVCDAYRYHCRQKRNITRDN